MSARVPRVPGGSRERRPCAGLTPRQVIALAAIRIHLADHCRAPTIGQLAVMLGVNRSTSAILVAGLVAKGAIACDYVGPRETRVLRVLDTPATPAPSADAEKAS